MQSQIDKLGKVSITIDKNYWDIRKDYDRLTVVEKEGTFGTYISRKPVPAGTSLDNREFWIPFSSLKEELLIDYNKFINKYKDQLDSYDKAIKEFEDKKKEVENSLNELKNDLTEIDRLKDYIEKMTHPIVKLTQDEYDNLDEKIDVILYAVD